MSLLPLVCALPWLIVPVVIAWRTHADPSLNDASPVPPSPAPLVSVIVPARDEAANIARCITSIAATTYPPLEVIVVDDRSADGTGDIARRLAATDPRVQVVPVSDMPAGWFGKQWACATGARVARGALLLFTDADTIHGPELVCRAVDVLRRAGADLVTVAGRQLMGSFWERVVQPQIFTIIYLRFGGARTVNHSRHTRDKLANGQFLLFERSAYDDAGGHAAVRDKVAEDLAFAQLFHRLGKRTLLVDGRDHLATRMYTSLAGIVRGWMKNVYAGSIDAAPFGSVGRFLLPVLLLAFPLATLAPPVILLMAVLGASSGALVWAALATVFTLAWWTWTYARTPGVSIIHALAYPAGAAIVLYIMVRAVSRGRHVEWRGRAYEAR